MNIPNFFIVGAPKCGTTALYTYLNKHPNIFFPTVKEPNFFCKDFNLRMANSNLSEYLNLFKTAKPCHKRIGEASVWYLYSQFAIPLIKKLTPTSKIIIMLRNPIEVVYSLHSQYLYNGTEDESDFEKAWYLQNKRRNGFFIPKTKNNDVKRTLYKEIGTFSKQIKRTWKHFPQNQIKIILFDDFIMDTKLIYSEVLTFLGLPDDRQIEFPRINENKTRKYSQLYSFYNSKSNYLRQYINKLYRLFNIQSIGIKKLLNKYDSISIKRKPLNPEFKRALSLEFSTEIKSLEDILKRDLSHWIFR